MCGLAGFIDFNKNSNASFLKEMNEVISHRGPDAEGYFFDDKENYSIGLGHRRLSIIDLNSEANQPMHFKNLSIVFNGEIYNYREIREELKSKGRCFKTKSDTEVILQSFDEWGDSCVDRFIGMFAFLIFDCEREEINVFRDRAGVKPFHFYWDQNIFLFSSEIKSFHQHPEFKKEINYSGLACFLKYGYVPTPESIFKNVQKLPPGSLLKFNLISKTITVQKYWNVDTFYEKPKLSLSFNEAKKQTEELIKSACEYRMVADVPVGVFLSGGYDSTLVTSILQAGSSSKIKTFTIGVEDQNLNEAFYAKEIAAHLGTEHRELYCNEKEMFDLIEKLPLYFDEPFGDSSAIPTMLVSKLAKEEVTVALSADGGDEVFGGYNRYDYLSKLEKVRTLAKFPLPFDFLLKVATSKKSEYRRISRLFKDPSAENLADILNGSTNAFELQKLVKFPIVDHLVNEKHLVNKIEGDLSRMMAYDYKTYLLDDILVKVDRATMSCSLEGREPLLDHRVLEFAAQLPDDFKINEGKKKHIIKEITHKYVPEKMMSRPKMGFSVPVLRWLQSPLREKLEYYLGHEFLLKQNLFNIEAITQLKEEILHEKDRHYQKLWFLLMFQMWYEKWILNEK